MKRALTRFLMGRLPAEEQARLADDVITWRFSHLSASERQALVEQLSPQLLQTMRQGRVGLPLLIAWHLLRLPVVRRLGADWPIAPHSAAEDGSASAGAERCRLTSTTTSDAPAEA